MKVKFLVRVELDEEESTLFSLDELAAIENDIKEDLESSITEHIGSADEDYLYHTLEVDGLLEKLENTEFDVDSENSAVTCVPKMEKIKEIVIERREEQKKVEDIFTQSLNLPTVEDWLL